MDCVFKGPSKDDPITNDPSRPFVIGFCGFVVGFFIGLICWANKDHLRQFLLNLLGKIQRCCQCVDQEEP